MEVRFSLSKSSLCHSQLCDRELCDRELCDRELCDRELCERESAIGKLTSESDFRFDWMAATMCFARVVLYSLQGSVLDFRLATAAVVELLLLVLFLLLTITLWIESIYFRVII